MSKTAMKITCQKSANCFSLNGKDSFLYSGEVHYFRIPRRYWRKHLEGLVEAGCNAVSTYVPWSWHEPVEGRVDISGKTHAERDLLGYIDLARELDLHVTVKPGPYVMAETTDQGIPEWLTRDYPETRAVDESGEPWGSPFVAHASTVFRSKAARWLTFFARKVVVPRQTLKRGAVIMMQLCNEIGIFQWLGAKGDYSAANLAAWQEYLRHAHPDVRELGDLLGRSIATHAEVMPPSGNCESRRCFVLYRLWHDYHRRLYGDYVGFLARTLRDAGVETPLFTNIGGWVYGRAHEFSLNGTFHRESARREPGVLFGLDHIPEFVSPLNIHDGIVANQTAAELQGRRGPLYSAELQCGSREHGVQPYPQELGLFYRHCMIHGLTGMNFYMFSQGRNPKGRGTDGPMFYWYNALDYKGQRQPSFPMIRELGEWLKHNGDALVATTRPAGLAVGFYPHLYETEFLTPVLTKANRLMSKQIGFDVDPVDFRNRAYFDGVLRILVQKSVPFDLADLTRRSIKELLRYRSLVVVSNELMDAETQAKLCQFVKAGGRLIIFPMLPTHDLDFVRCRILESEFGYETTGRSSSNRIYMDGLKDIPVPVNPFKLKKGTGRVLARDADGNAVGLEKKIGKGSVRIFGFHLHYTIEEHPELWAAMMQLSEAERNAWTESDSVHVEARFNGKAGLLFVGNFHRMPVTTKVAVRNPRGGAPIDLGEMTLPALHGMMLPIETEIARGLTLVCAHAELLERSGNSRKARFELRGPENSKGKLLIRSRRPVREITVDGAPASFRIARGVVEASYVQNGRRQSVEVRYQT